jgi:hypothetical protein
MRRLFLAALLGALLAGGGSTEIITRERLQTVTQVQTVRQVHTVTTTPEPTVYVAAAEGLLYKPSSLSYYGGHQIVDRIRWNAYGGPVAIAKAVFGRDDCNRGAPWGTTHTHRSR